MLFGMPWSGSWGNPEDFVEVFKWFNAGSGPDVIFKIRTGYDGWYALVVDGILQGQPIQCVAGTEYHLTGIWAAGDGEHIFTIESLGQWNSTEFNNQLQQTVFARARAGAIAADITVNPSVYASYPNATQEGNQFSEWNLTGFKRFTNCRPIPTRKTQGQLDLILTTGTNGSHGDHHLAIGLDGTTFAEGTIDGNGVITVVEQNSSGISGTVRLNYLHDIPNGKLVIRYPAQLKVYYKFNEPFGATDFPEDPKTIIPDDGYSNTFRYSSGLLPDEGGTDPRDVYLLIHQVDELGNEDNHLDQDKLHVATPPKPPGKPFLSLDSAGNPIVLFMPSPTVCDLVYNVYDSFNTGLLDTQLPNYTIDPGSGESSIVEFVLPPLTGTGISTGSAPFTGPRYVLIRAVCGGVEEGNGNILEIEYLDDVVIMPRPPAPGAQPSIKTVGLTLTVTATAKNNAAYGDVTTFELFVVPYGEDINWDAPVATVTHGEDGFSFFLQLYEGTLVYTASSDGEYIYAVRTRSSFGSQSSNTDSYGPTLLTTELPAAPTVVAREGV